MSSVDFECSSSAKCVLKFVIPREQYDLKGMGGFGVANVVCAPVSNRVGSVWAKEGEISSV